MSTSPTGRSIDNPPKHPPSVEILVLRHSKARYITLNRGRRLNVADDFEKARVDLLARLATYWSRH